MKKIPFLDLGKVNRVNKVEIDQVIKEVVDSGWYILGKRLKEFEYNFSESLAGKNCGYSIGCNSGTDALVLSLRSSGVKENDEVITVSHTAIPTISAIVSIGAIPVFVDVDPESWVMETSSLEAAITKKTKAIVCVHLYGNMVDVFEVKALLKKLNRMDIKVIEDVAQAHGASLKLQQAGTIGDFGAFSFYPSKNIGALGDGGAVFTMCSDSYRDLKMLRNYGQEDRYNAIVINGINSRLDEIQASVLNVKLKYLKDWNQKKIDLMNLYRKELVGLPLSFQKITPNSKPAWHLCVIKLAENIDRNKIMCAMEGSGLQTLIHYPYPTHLQKAFFKFYREPLTHTEKLASKIISLPFNYAMNESEVKEICGIVRKVLE